MKYNIKIIVFIKIIAILMFVFSFLYSLFIWINYFHYSFLGLTFCTIPFILMFNYVKDVFAKTTIEAVKDPIKYIFKPKQVYYCFVFFIYFSLKLYYKT